MSSNPPMSNGSTSATKRSSPSAFSRRSSMATSRHLTSEIIASDIVAFKQRGGRIEVLGNTASRSSLPSTTFRSSVKSEPSAATADPAKNAMRG